MSKVDAATFPENEVGLLLPEGCVLSDIGRCSQKGEIFAM